MARTITLDDATVARLRGMLAEVLLDTGVEERAPAARSVLDALTEAPVTDETPLATYWVSLTQHVIRYDKGAIEVQARDEEHAVELARAMVADGSLILKREELAEDEGPLDVEVGGPNGTLSWQVED